MELAEQMGLYGETAMTKRFEYIANMTIVAVSGSCDHWQHAQKLLKELL